MFHFRMFCGLFNHFWGVLRPITTNIMTPWLSEDTVLEWKWKIQMSPHLGSFLVIMKKLDVMLENSLMSIPLNWPYCLQMHNSPCIKCFEWICRSFVSHEKCWNECFHQRKWNHCEPCLLRAGQASFTVYQGHQQPLVQIIEGGEGDV